MSPKPTIKHFDPVDSDLPQSCPEARELAFPRAHPSREEGRWVVAEGTTVEGGETSEQAIRPNDRG